MLLQSTQYEVISISIMLYNSPKSFKYFFRLRTVPYAAIGLYLSGSNSHFKSKKHIIIKNTGTIPNSEAAILM